MRSGCAFSGQGVFCGWSASGFGCGIVLLLRDGEESRIISGTQCGGSHCCFDRQGAVLAEPVHQHASGVA